MIVWQSSIDRIVPREVAHVTESFIMHTDGRREAKRSAFRNWHASWEDAKLFLIDKAQEDIETCELRTRCARARLTKIEGLEKP